MPIKRIPLRDVPIADTPHKVAVQKLFDIPHATIVHITLQAGETLKKHITPVDVMFYVLEGTGNVEIGGETLEVHKDDLVFSPVKIPHRLFNSSNVPFRFLVIKTPTPTSETKIL